MKQIIFAFPCIALAACTTTAGYSGPVGIDLKAKSGDVVNGTLTERKDINTETGNPYGAFTNAATAQLGNRPPSRIELTSASLLLGGQSSGVASLAQVVTGEVDVSFYVDSSGNTYDAARVANPTGSGPVAMNVVFDWSQIAPGDISAMLNGQFKVVLRAPAAAGYATSNASADLETTFTFEALE
jgi:hypothetical protein